MRIRLILSSAAGSALKHFSILSCYRHDFRGGGLLNIKCVCLTFCTTFVRNISHSEKDSSRYYHKRNSVFRCSSHYSCQILMELEFSRQMLKNLQIWNLMKICQVGAEFCADWLTDGRTDRQTDRQRDVKKVIVAVRSSANAHKNRLLSVSEFVSDIRRMCVFIGIRRLDNYRSRPVEAVCITHVKGAE
jgi:hypothetical protein